MQKIEDKIKSLGTILTWLLGFLALIIAAMVSFIFKDLNALIEEYNFPNLEHAVLALLGVYLIIACSVLGGLIESFAPSDDGEKALERRYKKLKSVFRWNVAVVIISLLAVFFFVSYFLYS